MREIPKEIWFIINMWSVNSIISKRLDACLGSVHGIGFTEYMVLFYLNNSHNKVMRRIDLANSICLTAAGITRTLSPMEKIGVVMKERNPRDGMVILGNGTLSVKQNTKRLLDCVNKNSLTHALEVFNSIGKDIYV